MQRPSKRIITSALFCAVTALPVVAQQPMNMPQDQMQQQPPHEHPRRPTCLSPSWPRSGTIKSPLFTLEEAQRLAVESNPTLRQAEAENPRRQSPPAAIRPLPQPHSRLHWRRNSRWLCRRRQARLLRPSKPSSTAGKLARSRDVFSKETQLARNRSPGTENPRGNFRENRLPPRTGRPGTSRRPPRPSPKFSRTSLTPSASFRTPARLTNPKSSIPKWMLSAFASPPACRKILFAKSGAPSLLFSAAPICRSPPSPAISNTTGPTSTKIKLSNPSPRNLRHAHRRRQRCPRLRRTRPRQTRTHSRSPTPRRNGIQQRSPRHRHHAKGWEGIAEVGVQIPIFNRNQGNIAAATASLDRANLESSASPSPSATAPPPPPINTPTPNSWPSNTAKKCSPAQKRPTP